MYTVSMALLGRDVTILSLSNLKSITCDAMTMFGIEYK